MTLKCNKRVGVKFEITSSIFALPTPSARYAIKSSGVSGTRRVVRSSK